MQSTEPSPPAADVREALAGAVNDNHGCTRIWADLCTRTGLARTNGDDYAIRIAYQAADAILADPRFEVSPRGTVAYAPEPAHWGHG